MGYNLFAVSGGNECYSAPDAEYTYNKYGVVRGCSANGRGGALKLSVYKIVAGMAFI